MRLTTCCLSIRENSAVKSFHDAEHDWLNCLLIDEALRRVGVEYLIIVECVRSAIASRVCPSNLHCMLLNELDKLILSPTKQL